MKKETNYDKICRAFSERSKLLKIIFTVVFFAMSLLPAAAYLLGADTGNSENNEPAHPPRLFAKDGLNEDFDSDFEKYFSENFGFRQQLVTGLTAFDYYVLGTSAVDKVTAGRGNWLFLTETLDDFDGSESCSERTVYRIAETARLMDRYAQSKGSRFVFFCAPDKASVYPEYLPMHVKACKATNLDRLSQELKAEAFYIDVKKLFLELRSKNDTQYYYKFDSHWNNAGAIEVYRAVQNNIVSRYPDIGVPVEVSETDTVPMTHSGDLGRMLLPKGNLSENDRGFIKKYKALQPMNNLMAFRLMTEKADSEHSLYMFRDSFGNALIDLFSNNYAKTCYTRAVPYTLREAGEYDIIVLEKVERELSSIVANVPDAPCTQCAAPLALSETGRTIAVQITDGESEIKVSGILPDEILLSARDNIYVCVSGQGGPIYFEAYPIAEGMPDNDRGFCAVIDKRAVSAGEFWGRICVGDFESAAVYDISPT